MNLDQCYELSAIEFLQLRAVLEQARNHVKQFPPTKLGTNLESMVVMCNTIKAVPVTYKEDVEFLTDRWWEPADRSARIGGEPVSHVIERIHSRIDTPLVQETSFIVRREHCTGILFEIEYEHTGSNDHECFIESSQTYWGASIPDFEPHTIIRELVKRLRTFATKYPDIDVYVTQGAHVVENRIAVRVFIGQDKTDVLQHLGTVEASLYNALDNKEYL